MDSGNETVTESETDKYKEHWKRGRQNERDGVKKAEYCLWYRGFFYNCSYVNIIVIGFCLLVRHT